MLKTLCNEMISIIHANDSMLTEWCTPLIHRNTCTNFLSINKLELLKNLFIAKIVAMKRNCVYFEAIGNDARVMSSIQLHSQLSSCH